MGSANLEREVEVVSSALLSTYSDLGHYDGRVTRMAGSTETGTREQTCRFVGGRLFMMGGIDGLQQLGRPYTARHSPLNGQRQRNNRNVIYLRLHHTISTTLEIHRGIHQRGSNATETPHIASKAKEGRESGRSAQRYRETFDLIGLRYSQQ